MYVVGKRVVMFLILWIKVGRSCGRDGSGCVRVVLFW